MTGLSREIKVPGLARMMDRLAGEGMDDRSIELAIRLDRLRQAHGEVPVERALVGVWHIHQQAISASSAPGTPVIAAT